MNEFLFVFRMAHTPDAPRSSPEQMQSSMKLWQDWMGSLAAQDKLVSSGNRLSSEGMMVKPGNVVTNGPYVETKEAVGGYIMVKADSLEEAAALSAGCPIFGMNGTVEIRPIVPMYG